MQRYTYTVRIEKAERSGYVAFVPVLPGCQCYGDTYESALQSMPRAIYDYADQLLQSGQPVPVESEHREVRLEVELPEFASDAIGAPAASRPIHRSP